MARTYGVDVSVYQDARLNYPGAQFAIVKLTEGTGYQNPVAYDQITSAKKQGIAPMGYHFATFGANSLAAVSEANCAIAKAKSVGLPKGSALACDWETGDGNKVDGGVNVSASAVLAFMDTVAKAGYKPLLYSGASLLRNNINTKLILAKYPNSLWVAAYPSGNGTKVDIPNFNYFPSMDGVAIWQFTDNWKGMHVDGNVMLIDVTKSNPSAKVAEQVKLPEKMEVTVHPVVKWDVPRVFVVTNKAGATLYDDYDLKKSIGSRPQNSSFIVLDEKNGAIKVGKNQWFDGRAGITKSNPIAYDDYKSGTLKVMLDNTHALDAPKADAGKVYKLVKGAKYKFEGRKGRFLALKDKYKDKTVYVTGNRAFIVL
ncbi:GH25 family lysozyme M1 (1,4-beta-N-acetylmuramidase) [Lactobacillus colini]|uniref:GH25 family lysozyme M1 (1,4-beta-N-acetylmuramidase) n=1 Tax=Lactobacillus colini TaxID=1819254 RepID=A0ABS4ME01_9LACO|nr:GH25 family lysozyme [Lactobacillus colini]MBP2057915.1 GH25 family lysozyme M1 (1,4-beta-N-acetylmuramidase) [Lactobacillus colini]